MTSDNRHATDAPARRRGTCGVWARTLWIVGVGVASLGCQAPPRDAGPESDRAPAELEPATPSSADAHHAPTHAGSATSVGASRGDALDGPAAREPDARAEAWSALAPLRPKMHREEISTLAGLGLITVVSEKALALTSPAQLSNAVEVDLPRRARVAAVLGRDDRLTRVRITSAEFAVAGVRIGDDWPTVHAAHPDAPAETGGGYPDHVRVAPGIEVLFSVDSYDELVHRDVPKPESRVFAIDVWSEWRNPRGDGGVGSGDVRGGLRKHCSRAVARADSTSAADDGRAKKAMREINGPYGGPKSGGAARGGRRAGWSVESSCTNADQS